MKLAIMQPYFVPYIGYFQLMKAADEFVVYDNIQYTKAGWINRNRILVNHKDSYLTLPLKKDSDYLDICERSLAAGWNMEKKKILNRLRAAYHKAPYFERVYPLLEQALAFETENLFDFIVNSLIVVKTYLGITTPLIRSSLIPVDRQLRSADRVLALCHARRAACYLNPAGGTHLYDKLSFKQQGIELQFLQTPAIAYPQFGQTFLPSLSIIDVMMFNSAEQTGQLLGRYQLI